MNKQVLFVSTESIVSKLAESVFSAEAEKSQVAWQAACRVSPRETSYEFLPDSISNDALESAGIEAKESRQEACQLSPDDLQSFDLVVELRLPGQEKIIDAKFDAEFDVWRVNNDVVDELKQYVLNLMVRLIMQGGRRAPAASEENPPETTSGADRKNAKVRVSLDRKKRRGKKVTVITGLPLSEKEIYELAAKLKQLCGTGGTVKDGCIEVQGDKCDQIISELAKQGYKPKRSGG